MERCFITVCGYHQKHFPTERGMYKNRVEGDWKKITKKVLEYVHKSHNISHGLCDRCYLLELEQIERDSRREKFLDDKEVA